MAKEKMQGEFNILLSVYFGLSIGLVLIISYSFNYLTIKLIELFGESDVYKTVIGQINSFTSKHDILLWNTIVYFFVFPLMYYIIYDKIKLEKVSTIKRKWQLKIIIIALTIGSVYVIQNNIISKDNTIIYYILRDVFLIGTVSIMIWWAIWLATIFYNSKNPKLTGKLSKKQIFDLYKVNLSRSQHKGKYTFFWKTYDKMFLNMLNSRRGILLIGVAGSGKSFSIIEPVIVMGISQGQAIFNYDVKFPTLTEETYNAYLGAKKTNENDPRGFACIYPNDIRYTHQLNCFDPTITNTEAKSNEAVKTVLYNLNKSWVEKSGDFFVDSAIAYMVGVAWYLNIRQRETGKKISTLPHIIEIVTNPNAKMGLEVLLSNTEIQTIMTTIYTGYAEGATDQLAGQMGSLQTALGEISNKNLYYISCNSNIHADVNNYDHPTILNIGGAIETQKAYAPIISLYASTVKQVINKKNRLPMLYLVDEASTLYIENLQELPNTGRSNGITTLIGLQSKAQLILGYMEKAGAVLRSSFGNIIVGQILEKDLALDVQDLMGEQKVESTSKSKDHKGKFSTTYNKEWKKLIDYEFLKNLQPGEFVGSLSDMEENVLKTGRIKTANFATKLEVKPPNRNFKKLPYFNEELISLFKKEIENTPKRIILEYFKIHEIIKKLNENQENQKANVALEKENFYTTEEQKITANRFVEMFNNKYNYKQDIIKEESIIAHKQKKKTNTKEYIKALDEKIKIECKLRREKTKKYYNDNIKEIEETAESELKSIIENHDLKDYLLHFIIENYQEKEEQRLIDKVLNENYKRIKVETSNLILHDFIMLEIRKHFKSELLKNDDNVYNNIKEITPDEKISSISIDNIKEWFENPTTIDDNLLKQAYKIFNTNIDNLSNRISENIKFFDIEEETEESSKKERLKTPIDLDKFIIQIPEDSYDKIITLFEYKYNYILNSMEGKVDYTQVNKELISAIRNFSLSIYCALDSCYLKLKI